MATGVFVGLVEAANVLEDVVAVALEAWRM
jgi:hypothetical protein